jgi:cation transport ATPase
VLDKTGTVTTGRMKLVDVIPAAGTLDSELLRLAGALEDASEHPVAAAVGDQGVTPRSRTFMNSPCSSAWSETNRSGSAGLSRVAGGPLPAGW